MPDAIDDLFRRFGKAFNKADVEEIAACVTDDFEWRLNAGGAPAGRVLKGKDDLRAYFADKSKAHREARYSEAMKGHAGEWTFERLAKYLHNPAQEVPGNKMVFAGIPDNTDLADLLVYLRKLSDSPAALPTK